MVDFKAQVLVCAFSGGGKEFLEGIQGGKG